jgi:HlyD family secretion protein
MNRCDAPLQQELRRDADVGIVVQEEDRPGGRVWHGMHLRNVARARATRVFESGHGDGSRRRAGRISSPMQVPAPKPRLITHSGQAMDRAVEPPPPWRRRLPWIGMLALALVALAMLFLLRPSRIQQVGSAQLARVEEGVFRDEVMLRARVEPLRSVQLDAAEAGRVEEVFAHDGDWVEAGTSLYKLHSPEQEQLLMQRSAEVAQQMANVSLQRSAQAASIAQNRRELAQLRYAHAQADSDYQRQVRLSQAGFASAMALENGRRQEQLAAQLLEQAREDQRVEADIRQRSLDEMQRAVEGLQRGLQLLERARERLTQQAPLAGRLSGFSLQVGMSVRLGDRLGRIDDPTGGVQLAAEVDEFYLPRLRAGQKATSASGTVTLAQALPQVTDGKVRVLLRWPDAAAPAGLRPGQAVDVRLQLSEATPALLLPDGPGVQSTLYVQAGDELRRRDVRLGRRAGGQVEVLSGLRAGDNVLISQPPSNAPRLALP